MNDQATFWDRVARKYAAKPVADEAAYEDTLARVRAHLTGADGVLEIGCGTGTTALKLAPYLGHILATDISGEMIAIAEEKRTSAAAENVRFEVGGAGASDLPEGPFNMILAMNLLHLLPEWRDTVEAAVKRLQPGGFLISKSGLLGEAPFWLGPMISVMRMFGKAPPVARFSCQELDQCHRDLGLNILETKTYPGMAPTRLIIAQKPG